MTKRTLWALAGLLLIVSMSCMFVEDRLNPTTAPPLAPQATATMPSAASTSATTPPPSSADMGTFVLTINNQTPYDICYVYIAPTVSDSWGQDWLTDEGSILANTAQAFNVPHGTYDVLVEDCDHATLGTAWEVDTTTTVTFGGKNKVALRMTNDSDTDICFVHISPSSNDPGEDLLGEQELILPGDERIFFIDPGTYTITVDDCDHNQLYTESGASISGETQRTIPSSRTSTTTHNGKDFQVTVNNETPEDICYVYISPADSDTWGNDWLEDDTLSSGESHTFYVSAGTYDMKVENCDEVTLDTSWGFSSEITLSPGSNGDLPITVINHTDDEICYLFISPTSSDSWGEDLLGSQEVIPVDGGRRMFYIQPGEYDLRSEDCDENPIAELNGISIQTAYSWDITQ